MHVVMCTLKAFSWGKVKVSCDLRLAKSQKGHIIDQHKVHLVDQQMTIYLTAFSSLLFQLFCESFPNTLQNHMGRVFDLLLEKRLTLYLFNVFCRRKRPTFFPVGFSNFGAIVTALIWAAF